MRKVLLLCVILLWCGSLRADQAVYSVKGQFLSYDSNRGLWQRYDATKGWVDLPSTYAIMWQASWCRWCPHMYPIIDRLIGEGWPISYADSDSAEYQPFLNSANINRIPTIVIYSNGREVQRRVGIIAYSDLLNLMVSTACVKGPPCVPPKHKAFTPSTQCGSDSCPGGFCPRPR